MTLAQLIERFRIEAGDLVKPYLWETDWLATWFAEAQDEAAVRARLLLDDFTPAVTQVAVLAGQDSYALHPKLYEIARLDFTPAAGRATDLHLTSREKLDHDEPGWRPGIRTAPSRPIPASAWCPCLRRAACCAWRPTGCRSLANDNDKPEIHEARHIHLVQWALYRAFGKPDADAHDPEQSAGPRRWANLSVTLAHDPTPICGAPRDTTRRRPTWRTSCNRDTERGAMLASNQRTSAQPMPSPPPATRWASGPRAMPMAAHCSDACARQRFTRMSA